MLASIGTGIASHAAMLIDIVRRGDSDMDGNGGLAAVYDDYLPAENLSPAILIDVCRLCV
jgi:hypothetical protein